MSVRVNPLSQDATENQAKEVARGLHPSWQALIHYCEKLQFGELEKVMIQNGLPVSVELVRTRMRFKTGE